MLDEKDKQILEIIENHPLHLSIEGVAYSYTLIHDSYTSIEEVKQSLQRLYNNQLIITKGRFYAKKNATTTIT